MDFETPEADAVEQQQDASESEEDLGGSEPEEVPLDVDAADLAEQRAAVPVDDGYEHD